LEERIAKRNAKATKDASAQKLADEKKLIWLQKKERLEQYKAKMAQQKAGTEEVDLKRIAAEQKLINDKQAIIDAEKEAAEEAAEEAAKAAEEQEKSMKRRAESIKESVLKPVEVLRKTLAELKMLQSGGFLQKEFADRARKEAFATFNQATAPRNNLMSQTYGVGNSIAASMGFMSKQGNAELDEAKKQTTLQEEMTKALNKINASRGCGFYGDADLRCENDRK
jgi:hypothetical protein